MLLNKRYEVKEKIGPLAPIPGLLPISYCIPSTSAVRVYYMDSTALSRRGLKIEYIYALICWTRKSKVFGVHHKDLCTISRTIYVSRGLIYISLGLARRSKQRHTRLCACTCCSKSTRKPCAVVKVRPEGNGFLFFFFKR